MELVFLFGMMSWGCTVRSGDAGRDSGDAIGLNIPVTAYRPPPTYSKRVQNPYGFPVSVMVGGQYAGWLNPGAYTFLNLPAGAHTITFLNPYGQPVGERTIRVSEPRPQTYDDEDY